MKPTTKVKIRRPYDDSQPTSITFPETTMAKQSFAGECDINTIMAKYERTGLIDHVNKVQSAYGDFTSVQDYQLCLNQVIEAQDAFDELPSRVRERFANDPSRLMEFVQDEANYDEAVKLGLVPAKKIPASPDSKDAPPVPPAPPSPPEAQG